MSSKAKKKKKWDTKPQFTNLFKALASVSEAFVILSFKVTWILSSNHLELPLLFDSTYLLWFSFSLLKDWVVLVLKWSLFPIHPFTMPLIHAGHREANANPSWLGKRRGYWTGHKSITRLTQRKAPLYLYILIYGQFQVAIWHSPHVFKLR